MANQEHLDILAQGVEAWNLWRKQHPEKTPDLGRIDLSWAHLSGIDLSQANLDQSILHNADLSSANLSYASMARTILENANLSSANLSMATLTGIYLYGANLKGATLKEANLARADLTRADLSGADLRRAHLYNAELSGTSLKGANLKGADLRRAILVGTNLCGANLTNCWVYGISTWDVQLQEAKQFNLFITEAGQSMITVDNLEVAQFIYLLLNNTKIREVIDTIGKKAVLILGRFTPKRKAVLDALRDALRIHGYVPILFDFEKPSSQDFTETVSTLAHLSRFIVADLTDPSSIPQELYAIVPHRMVPVQPLLKESEDPNRSSSEYSMFIDLRKKYHWVLSTHRYKDLEDLLTSLEAKVIEPAERKVQELEKR